ncbi:hypothetical protein ACL1FJ_00710 [Corynebacterium striatum]
MAETTKNNRPAKAEAFEVEEIDFTVNIKGKDIKIVCPADLSDAPFEVAEAFEEGKNLKAFMGLIGESQAAKLRAAGMTPRIFADEVIPAWQEASGMGE